MRDKRTKKQVSEGKKEPIADEVDYAAAADLLANHDDDNDDEVSETQEIQDDNDSNEDCDVSDNDSNEESDVDDNDDDEDEDEEMDENENGTDESGDEEADNEEHSVSDSVSESRVKSSGSVKFVPNSAEPCSFDLRNLLAVNSHQLNSERLYRKQPSSIADTGATIPRSDNIYVPDEKYLLEKAVDGCSQLIHALWHLPVERSDAGPLVILPSHDESRIPRALPPPEPKKETKWEKFAREKGIANNKEKRSRKVWDEATGTWLFRHGYQKANDKSKEWPIMEVNDNDNPYEDPWERLRDEKNERVGKNREQRMKNEERAGNLAKGSTNRLLKNAEHRRNAGKAGGLIDRNDVPPSGLPVDISRGGLKKQREAAAGSALKRGKESTVKALLATQRSTASLGKFDKMREGEPERKKSDKKALTKRKSPSGSTDPTFLSNEKERALKVLKTVNDGGIQKEKDRKKGRLATGESAYDYDYDDGLGPTSFRKKKGRAGAGKMKKMTKKRVK